MKKLHRLFAFLFLGLITPILSAQNLPESIRKGFESGFNHRQVFIENNGQWNGQHTDGQPVEFEATVNTLPIYFTASGLTVVYPEKYFPEEALEEIEREGKLDMDDEIMEKAQVRYHYLRLNWKGCNLNANIISEDRTSYYFTYPDNRSGKTPIAYGYKKITYKDLYPGIDAEYILPSEGGFKYNLIVHPGADLTAVQMEYNGSDNIEPDGKGGLRIVSPFITLEEKAPRSFYEDQTHVNSSFIINPNGTIGFQASYQSNMKLIIDPFVSVMPYMPPDPILPPNQPVRTGFDVCYDYAGNVYVYGGACPYHALKFSPAGALLWDSQFPLPIAASNAVGNIAGDMEVDKRSGSVYVSEGFAGYTIGACIFKLNTSGVMVGQMNGLNTAAFSTPLRGEISRIRLDYCNNIIYMSCGGVPTGSKQVAQIDTALTPASYKDGHVTSSNNGDHDACLMALDPGGQFLYMNFNKPCPGSPDFLHDNELYKIPLPNYNPSAFINPGPTYGFVEVSTLNYAGWSFPNPQRINMFNGMVCGNSFLYTSDGRTLKKFNKTTGAQVGSILTGGKMYWSGGLDLDNCENIYVSVSNAVKVYDLNFNLITTYALPDTSCYDIRVDVGRKLLYATGNGYVASIPIALTTSNPQISANSTSPTTCSNCDGTASVIALQPQTCDTLKFTYQWSPGGQTTASVTGLCAGTYSVKVSYTSLKGCGKPKIDTILVVTLAAPQGALQTQTSSNSVSCFGGNNGSASINITGGTAPYTYSWSNGQFAATATGLSPGNYTVTVSDAGGCTSLQVVNVTQPTAVTASTSVTSVLCFGAQNGSAQIIASGGTPGYAFSWSNGQSAATASGLSGGNYNVTVTDVNGCTSQYSVTVNEPPALTATANSVNLLCFGNSNGAASVSASGGTPGYNYVWNNGQTGTAISSLTSGTYSVVITDANGCTSAQSVTVTQPAALSASVTPFGIPCSIGTGSATVTGGGGTPGYTYSWSNGQSGASITGLAMGNYSVLVTDANGCFATQSFTINASPAPVASFTVANNCQNSGTAFTNSSSGNPISWFWDFGDGFSSSLQSPSHIYQTAGTYTVTMIASLSPGCSDTTQQVLTIHPNPVANFTASAVCAGNTTYFTDLSNISSGSISSWFWNFGNGNTSTAQNPSYTYPAAGSFSVSLTVTSANGCTASYSMPVGVHASPSAGFCVTPSQQPISDPVFNFCDQWSNDVAQWFWSFGDGDSNTFLTDPSHSYSAAVTNNDFYSFQVCLNVQNQYGCWDSTCKIVELIPEFTFYIPNTFTPNGDQLNPFFFGKGRGIKEYQIWVFDRWGNLIWDCGRSDDNVNWDQPGKDGLPSSCQWNGNVEKGGVDMSGSSGQGVQEDVYVWKVALKDIFNRRHQYIGNVNVVR